MYIQRAALLGSVASFSGQQHDGERERFTVINLAQYQHENLVLLHLAALLRHNLTNASRLLEKRCSPIQMAMVIGVAMEEYELSCITCA